MNFMKNFSKYQHILYAPGRGYDLSVLNVFRNELSKRGYIIHLLPTAYDEGYFNQTDLLNRIPIECTWWIGISLGASVLWTLSSLVESRSIRLTVINPFADRERLSREKGFNLRGQWNFKPIDYQSVAEHIDVVVSIYDEAIGARHSLELLSSAQPEVKKLILVKSDHQINNLEAQIELVKLLTHTEEDSHADGKYCDIYSPAGKI